MPSILLLTVLPVVAFLIFAVFIAMRQNNNEKEDELVMAAYNEAYYGSELQDIDKYKKAFVKEGSILKSLYQKKKAGLSDADFEKLITSDEYMKKLRALEKSTFNESDILDDVDIIDIVTQAVGEYKAVGYSFNDLWAKIKSDGSLDEGSKGRYIKSALERSYQGNNDDSETAIAKRKENRNELPSSAYSMKKKLLEINEKAKADTSRYDYNDFFSWYKIMLDLTKKYDNTTAGGAKKKRKPRSTSSKRKNIVKKNKKLAKRG